MPRLWRALAAIVVAISVGIVPLVLDVCAATCAVHGAQADAGTGMACHHSSSSGPHARQDAASCAHDHEGLAGTVASERSVHVPALVVAVSPVPAVLSTASGFAIDRERSDFPPDVSSPATDRLLPLRI